ncbi:hypothetical protein [Rathayibacter sp. Leaf248]|uniref:hypothetical protein n=1 Tax=Rathayibacter sp. Leaf248 TaxID=2876555 RepID=UPI001E3E8AB2|nr:hypothetical protein [Rathayibacter sp. Leaf248]
MPMTPEQRRVRDRERKAKQRAANKGTGQLATVTEIDAPKRPNGGTQSGTRGGTSVPHSPPAGPVPATLTEAAQQLIARLDVPESALDFASALLLLARDLDEPANVPQRAGLMKLYVDMRSQLRDASRAREVDPLDEMRRDFYSGGTQSDRRSS